VTPPQNNTRVTVELGELIESGFKLWDFDYPSFYKGDAKLAFEQKVVDHYYFRQIGQETPARFRHYFQTRIREIMPYYIQLYESEAMMKGIEDPFGNVDITETYEETREISREGSSSASDQSESEQSNAGEDRFSDTPQGSIDNLDNYLTSARKTSDTGSASSSGSSSSESSGTESETVSHTYTKKGNQGVNTYAHDMRELRETFLNIDLEIIEKLNDLFLLIY
jgi:hypothetical protein